MIVARGTYTGTGSAGSAIDTGNALGSGKWLLRVKGTSQIAVFKTATMTTDAADSVKNATGNLATQTGVITSVSGNTFVCGTDARANANGTTYGWLLVKDDGDGTFDEGKYTGNGSDSRNITISLGTHTPDLVFVLSNSTRGPVCKFALTATADAASALDGANTANLIQALGSDTFQVGTDAYTNSNTVVYYYAALYRCANRFFCVGYTGDGSDPRSITGFGFNPEEIFNKSEAARVGTIYPNPSAAGDSTAFLSATAATSNLIQSLISDGYTVGSSTGINTVGGTEVYNSAGFKTSAATTTGRSPTMLLLGVG